MLPDNSNAVADENVNIMVLQDDESVSQKSSAFENAIDAANSANMIPQRPDFEDAIEAADIIEMILQIRSCRATSPTPR